MGPTLFFGHNLEILLTDSGQKWLFKLYDPEYNKTKYILCDLGNLFPWNLELGYSEDGLYNPLSYCASVNILVDSIGIG